MSSFYYLSRSDFLLIASLEPTARPILMIFRVKTLHAKPEGLIEAHFWFSTHDPCYMPLWGGPPEGQKWPKFFFYFSIFFIESVAIMTARTKKTDFDWNLAYLVGFMGSQRGEIDKILPNLNFMPPLNEAKDFWGWVWCF